MVVAKMAGDFLDADRSGCICFFPSLLERSDQVLQSSRIVFVPRYDGTILAFKVILLSDAGGGLEGRDAK